MEIIPLSGYTEDEKHEIAKQHLLAIQIKNHGLKESEFSLSDDGLKELIRRYTREAHICTAKYTDAYTYIAYIHTVIVY